MDTGINSYEDAFYKIADALGISARADTPNNVFQNEMLPRIMKLLSMEKASAALSSPQVAPALKPVAWRVSTNGEYHLFNTKTEAQRERDEYEKYEREFENDPVEHEAAEPLFLAAPVQVAPVAEVILVDYKDAQNTAWQAAAAFRPPYFGDDFQAHGWIVEAIRSAHMDGQRFAIGLPKIDRAVGGELPQDLRAQRTAPVKVASIK